MSSGQGGDQSVCVVGDCGVVSGGSARDGSYCSHDLQVYAEYSSNESSCSSAGSDSFGFVSLAVVVVGLVKSLPDIGVRG